MRVKYSSLGQMFNVQPLKEKPEMTIAWGQDYPAEYPANAPATVREYAPCPRCGNPSLYSITDPEIGPYVKCTDPGCSYTATQATHEAGD